MRATATVQVPTRMLHLKPEIWAQHTVGERMERLLGWSLDDCKAILEWEVNNPNITHGTRNIMVNAKIQVIKAVLTTMVKSAEQIGGSRIRRTRFSAKWLRNTGR